jgi:hypothetical protein
MKRIISVILACIILISIGSGGLVSAANEALFMEKRSYLRTFHNEWDDGKQHDFS